MRAYIVIFFVIIFLCILLGATLGSVIANPGVVYLIHVHGPDGEQEIEVNVQEISSIRQPREGSTENFAEGTRCILYMSNSKFIMTAETCREIVKKIAALDEPNPEKRP